MSSKTGLIGGLMLLLVLVTASGSSAQEHTRYKLIDMGTFGGPASYFTDPGNGPGFLVLSDQGVVVGRASTSMPDPNLPNFCLDSDCFLAHAFRWKDGVLTDLGLPAGAILSQATGVNARGWISTDYSTNEIDPLTGGPIFRGALWKDGQFIKLPPLGDGIENNALYVNNGGQVVGFSSVSTTPDPFSFIGGPIHPFIWQNGVLRDLGTLGGPDALPATNCNNQRSDLVTGFSLIDSTPNPDTGIPTFHPFLWQNGKMIDLGTLGGTLVGELQCANDAGQVAGAMTLAGNSVLHAFLWEHGVMRDLGTLGGDNSSAAWINNAGDIVGDADLPGSETNFLHHAFLWRTGKMIDLGSLGSTSHAHAVNSKGQVVGKSRLGDPFTELQHAFLWENGGPMIDLNTLIPPNSPLELYNGENINDLGWIAGRGLPPGCDDKDACGHAFLLIPCDPAQGQDCSPVTATQNNGALPSKQSTTQPPQRLTPTQRFGAWRTRVAGPYHNAASRE
jgi:probable HAF family extracellular repeat protein